MPDDSQKVILSQRLWSEEVSIAEADHPLPRRPVVYEFGGGRRLFREPDPE